MKNAYVVILMGSSSDQKHAEEIAATLTELGVPYVMRIGSAHKTPHHVLSLLQTYEADPTPKVYITIAGRSNALSAFVDTQVTAPVIACPPLSSSFGGADIFSSLRMPSGVAPAVVIDPSGAAILAAKMLGLFNPATQQQVKAMQTRYAEAVIADDQTLTGDN